MPMAATSTLRSSARASAPATTRAGVRPDLGRVVLHPAAVAAGSGGARPGRPRRSARRGRTGCTGSTWCPDRSRRHRGARVRCSAVRTRHCSSVPPVATDDAEGWRGVAAGRRVPRGGLAPPRRGRVRRRRHRRRGHGRRRGAGRRHPRAVGGPRRGPRLRRRNVEPLVEAVPRRAALPRAARVRPGARGAARARADDHPARAAPGQAGAVPVPADAPRLGASLRRGRACPLRHDGRAQQPARAEAPVPPRGAADVPGSARGRAASGRCATSTRRPTTPATR